MKRITNIKFRNYRAFYGKYELTIPKGENLLIYGENGSGKSSVYKALKDFFASSEDPGLQFWHNVYVPIPPAGPLDGTVEVSFNDYPILDPINARTFNFSTIPASRDAQSEPYIKKANKAKAFLSYQELVKTYIVPQEELPNPNLYSLIIENLLSSHTLKGPNISGMTIEERWKILKKDLDINSARVSKFKKAKDELPEFEQDLLTVLKPVLVKTNFYLKTFFKNQIITDIDNLIVRAYKVRGGKGWGIDKLLRLNVNVFSSIINNGYHNHLNEARLSAIAICLYLAGIKLSPQPDEYRILFLDDVFIGLDTSNRLPLLELLKAEFSDHQIFISTYDRHWYETSIRWFNAHMKGAWIFNDMYVQNFEDPTTHTILEKPILVLHESYFSKAQVALKNNIKPDYPGAANNFRKYAEEILMDKYFIPEQENRNQFATSKDEYGELTKAYKLTQILANALHFINSIHQDEALLLELQGHLSTLLHPLSHFELASPVYKGELLRIEDCLLNLVPFLERIKQYYKPVALPLKKMRLKFIVSANVIRTYAIVRVPQLYLVRNDVGNLSFSDCACYTPNVSTETIGAMPPIVNRPCDFKNQPDLFKFGSLADACATLRNADIANPLYSAIPIVPDYIDVFEYTDDSITWHPLRNLLIW
jgi:energy-coupling factor transporter ATP-binding protein EcfA2